MRLTFFILQILPKIIILDFSINNFVDFAHNYNFLLQHQLFVVANFVQNYNL